MFVHPVPHRGIDQRHPGDLVGPPEIVQGFHGFAGRVGRGQAKQGHVLALKNERQRLGESRIGHTFEQGVIDIVQREGLFHVVPHLVHGDVEAFVVHARFFHASAQVRFLRAHLCAHGVARAACRIDHDVFGHITGTSFREAQLHQQVRNIFPVGPGGRIFFRDDRIQLGLAVFVAGTKTVVPDVERLERTSQARLDKFRNLWNQRRSEHLFQHRFQPLFRNFTILIEAAVDQSGRSGRIRIGHSRGPIGLHQSGVTGVGLGSVRDREVGPRGRIGILRGRGLHLVGERIPVHVRIIDHDLRNGLRNDPLHDLLDGALLRQAILRVGIVRFDFVAQVPVA